MASRLARRVIKAVQSCLTRSIFTKNGEASSALIAGKISLKYAIGCLRWLNGKDSRRLIALKRKQRKQSNICTDVNYNRLSSCRRYLHAMSQVIAMREYFLIQEFCLSGRARQVFKGEAISILEQRH